MSEFERFGLGTPEPVWSSAALERAIDRELASSPASDLIRRVHGLLDRAELSRAHQSFVLDFVRALMLKAGTDLGDLSWLGAAIDAPAQALLAVYLLPEERLDPDVVLAILARLEGTDSFEEAVVELQDAVLRPEAARRLFAARPDLAKRVRAALSH
jgi:hypothetical protein